MCISLYSIKDVYGLSTDSVECIISIFSNRSVICAVKPAFHRHAEEGILLTKNYDDILQ